MAMTGSIGANRCALRAAIVLFGLLLGAAVAPKVAGAEQPCPGYPHVDCESAWLSSSNGIPSPSNLESVSCPTTSRCWAVGWRSPTVPGARIVATSDGGRTWTSQTSPVTDALESVSCPSVTHCWAVSISGQIIATTNGGASWSTQTSPTTAGLRGVSCPTTSQCWAVGTLSGSSTTIITTSNGGTTWTSQSAPSAAYLMDVSCATTSNCTAVGQTAAPCCDPAIFATTNGGATWTAQTAPNLAASDLVSVSCPTASVCWAAGHWTLIRTSNGGSTWTSQFIPDAYVGRGVSCASTTHCRVISGGADGAVIYSTSNAGTKWWAPLIQNSNTVPPVGLNVEGAQDTSCASTDRCVAVSNSGTALRYVKLTDPSV